MNAPRTLNQVQTRPCKVRLTAADSTRFVGVCLVFVGVWVVHTLSSSSRWHRKYVITQQSTGNATVVVLYVSCSEEPSAGGKESKLDGDRQAGCTLQYTSVQTSFGPFIGGRRFRIVTSSHVLIPAKHDLNTCNHTHSLTSRAREWWESCRCTYPSCRSRPSA